MPPANSKYSLITLYEEIRKSESVVGFLQDHGILNSSANCKKCSKDLKDVHKKTGSFYYYFTCSDCGTMVSIRDGTILSRANIPMRTFTLLTYAFSMLQGLTLTQKIHEVILRYLPLYLFTGFDYYLAS